ncbi:GTP cyclohydrolase I [Streptomyces sp. UNOC14_S4]|uniref:GTP cyclohydrolase I n=1 Tax=Streptomyces sp. UNOC14_S4 TaxID=2872340 RepID=UPI001E302CEC|nr:GTP cyclohydrolase I [Streptomyces sp. UNOC14_S4]MCC3772591.1 GTP cyclohydrolase I [Streptomyces sp. UNOC14_S4]
MTGKAPARHLLAWLGELFPGEPQIMQEIDASIAENHKRIDKAYAELLEGYRGIPKDILKVTLEVDAGSHHGLVRTTDVPFSSFCAHHFLPFFGTVDLTYRPGRYILGLGKIPRLIHCRSRRFQLQELLVRELAEDMVNHGDATYVRVVSRARHMCICYRGPNDASTVNETTYQIGEPE